MAIFPLSRLIDLEVDVGSNTFEDCQLGKVFNVRCRIPIRVVSTKITTGAPPQPVVFGL